MFTSSQYAYEAYTHEEFLRCQNDKRTADKLIFASYVAGDDTHPPLEDYKREMVWHDMRQTTHTQDPTILYHDNGLFCSISPTLNSLKKPTHFVSLKPVPEVAMLKDRDANLRAFDVLNHFSGLPTVFPEPQPYSTVFLQQYIQAEKKAEAEAQAKTAMPEQKTLGKKKSTGLKKRVLLK